MPAKLKKRKPAVNNRVPLFGAILLVGLLAGGFGLYRQLQPKTTEAPEAARILEVQAHMPFQILIPAYMPKEFDRLGVEIQVDQVGPGGEPMIQLMYSTRKGKTLFVREWVPVNPASEILAASRPVETKWGKGWLLKQGESLAALWIDVGPLRVSIYSPDPYTVTPEQLLEMAETIGPASNQQVFSFVVDLPDVHEVEPAPPFEVPVNAEGVQELTLVVTPGGYTPVRFSVKQGVPVRLIFRQLGQVGCGNVLIFPIDSQNSTALTLETPEDKEVLDFTPTQTGEFQFTCSHQMYRGVMVVLP
ncbi:MAG: hypothetical protein EHM70_26485 [Chloroflexota bacterium]|nr:MAG: hypothetical protein EHM70_26485 [Chloroflexota bacterium]